MSDKFAPKLTAKQRAQVEAVIKELMDKTKQLLLDDECSPDSAQGLLKEGLPWIEYLNHAAADGEKGSSVRSSSKRIVAAKKIKRSLKKTPTIADLQAEQSLTAEAELDEKIVAILDKDLSRCCSELPPALWSMLESKKD